MIENINNNGLYRTKLSSSDAVSGEVGKKEAAQAGEAPRTDSVTLSSNAASLSAAKEAALASPDVNQDRIAAIRAAIASGEYKVDDLVLAEKLTKFEALLR